MNFFDKPAKLATGNSALRSKHCVSFLLGLVLVLLHSVAAAKDAVDVDPINNVNFGTWSNSGSWSTTTSTCVLSATTKGRPKAGDSTVPYNAKVTNLLATDGFYLYLNGNGSATGSERIFISFAHRDLLDGSLYENLVNDVYDTHTHLGQFRNCPLGKNSDLRIDVTSAELATKVNGVFTGTFEFSARNTDDAASVIFNVQLSVQKGSQVKISNLNPVNFGQHSGLGNLAVNERLCVYSNAASGSYRISISSTNQDAGGNFNLANTVSGDLIPLLVYFADSGAGTASTPVLNNFYSGIGNNSSTDCGGIDNATLSLSMREADLQAAKTGTYSQTLIIMVEPE